MRFFLTAILLLPLIVYAQNDSLMIHYRSGMQAYEQQDYEGFYQAMSRATEIRPGHPTLTYNLAAGSALTGRKSQALTKLNEFVLMNATHDFQADSDFVSIRGDEAFQKLIELQKRKTESVTSSTKAFELSFQDFHPESITFNSRTNIYFFGDVRSRRIIQSTPEGATSVWMPQQEDMYCVMGIVIDEKKNELWATTAALPEMVDYDSTVQGKSSVFVFDMDSKTLKYKWLFDDRLLVGITQSPAGAILLGDVTENQVLTIRDPEKGAEIMVDVSDRILNIQGMTYNNKGSRLYLSDYLTGLYYLDEGQTLTAIELPENVSYKGIDGLYWHKNTLYATQNGTQPMRAYRFLLNAKGNKVVKAELLDQAGILGEPTTGTFNKTNFLFIANSPWGAYDKSGNFNPKGPIVILSQPLK